MRRARRDDVVPGDRPGHARESSAATGAWHNARVEVFFLMMGLWLVVAVALGMRRPRGLRRRRAARAARRRLRRAARARAGRRRRRSPRPISSSTTARAAELEAQRLRVARRRRGPDAVADLSAEPDVPAAVRRRGRDDPRERVSPASARRRDLAAAARAAVPAPPARRSSSSARSAARSSSRATRTASIGSSRRPRPRSSACRSRTPLARGRRAPRGADHRALARASRALAGDASRRFEDVLASIARAHVAMARHRQKVGGLSRDELERLKGRPLSATEEAFLREVQTKGKGEPTSS